MGLTAHRVNSLYFERRDADTDYPAHDRTLRDCNIRNGSMVIITWDSHGHLPLNTINTLKHFFVRIFDSKTCKEARFLVRDDTVARALKLMYSYASRVPPLHQCLVSCGIPLEDNDCLWQLLKPSEPYLDITCTTYVRNDSRKITIFVQTLSGSTNTFLVNVGDTVDSLKNAVGKANDISKDDIRFSFDGKQLEDQSYLFCYDIKDGSTIVMVQRVRGGGPGNTIPGFSQYDAHDYELPGLGCKKTGQSTTSKHVRPWPGGAVPYTLSRNMNPALGRRTTEAVASFNSQVASVRWTKQFPQQSSSDFVSFESGTHNKSVVGNVGGCQKISLKEDATVGTIQHEMLHTLGLKHEHKRPDRDQHVSVRMDQVEESRKHDYRKERLSQASPLDVSSMTHYSGTAKGKDGKPIISTKRKADASRIGQRNALSENDIASLESIHGKELCSFERYGERPWPQHYAECATCWGTVSPFVCCMVCYRNCHAGHLTMVRKKAASLDVVCHCGRNCHQSAVCSRNLSGMHRMKEKEDLYRCLDCGGGCMCMCRQTQTICFQCSQNCHAGHDIVLLRERTGSCTCGSGGRSTPCTIPAPTSK